MSSVFDPSSVLNETYSESNSTARIPIPEGEHPGVIEDVQINQWQTRDGSKSGLKLDVRWAVDSAEAREATGLPSPTCRQSIMLDLTEQGGLDMSRGKNTNLGRLRAATGLNTPGEPFAFSMLVGKAARVKIAHRVDGENIYDEVKGVVSL